MNHKLTDLLITFIDDVAFTDVVAGIAYPIKIRVGDLVKTIPAYYNHDKTECKASDYVNLVPNSKHKSIMYFEDNGTTLEQQTAHYSTYNSNIRLVCWLNYKQIDLNEYDHSTVVQDILSRIPSNFGNYGIYNRIQFKVNAIVSNTADIFYKYSYDEADSQYLTYPYYAVAFDISVRYTMANECIGEIITDPTECIV